MLRGLNTPVAIILSEISENYWNNIIHVQSYKILFPNCLLYISLPCSSSIKIKNNFYMNQIIKLHTIVQQEWLKVGTLWNLRLKIRLKIPKRERLTLQYKESDCSSKWYIVFAVHICILILFWTGKLRLYICIIRCGSTSMSKNAWHFSKSSDIKPVCCKTMI